jgi:hypothetical protein
MLARVDIPELLMLMLPFAVCGPAIACLMYFHFRTRPPTWPMRIVAVGVALAMWFCVGVCLYLSAEYTWEFGRGNQPLWASALLVIIIVIPLCYVAAYFGCVALAIIDRARARALSWWCDPPDIFSGDYWTESRFTRSLVVFPVMVLAAIALLSEIAKSVPVYSVLAVTFPNTNPILGRENYHLVHPLLFRQNETSEISVRKENETLRSAVTCTLSSPGFDLQEVPIGHRGRGLLRHGTDRDESMDCLWLATPRHTGSQTLLLAVSIASPDSKPAAAQSRTPDALDIESVHVVSEAFTFSVCLIAALVASFLVGLLRLVRVGEQSTVTDAPSDLRRPEVKKVKIQVESKLYSGETKLK